MRGAPFVVTRRCCNKRARLGILRAQSIWSMASGLVIHISSGENKHTEILTDEHIRIGRTEDCDLRLRASDLPPTAESALVLLELARTNGVYRVINFDHTIEFTHNGDPLKADADIKDGDEVRFQ